MPPSKGKQKQTEELDPALKRTASSSSRRPDLPADKPFDFNRFLEQMKHRSAVPVNEYVRSFFRGFSRRPYKPDEQVKLIFDFLEFIAARMAEAEVWASLSPSDFDQATEAMEKLVMNRLYTYTFSPAIALEGRWPVQTDDLQRDQALSERIQLFAWVDETHLDVPRGPHSERFYNFATQELAKINHYKAPRDKTICVLNCCKVIFGLIRHLGAEEGADAFMPLLILVVLRANPPHLVSNLEYINRFRTPQRRTSESEYYLSSLSGAMTFIENMDHTTLSNVTQEELDTRVQRAAATMEAAAAERAAAEAQSPTLSLTASMAAASLADDTRAFLQRTSEAARVGFSRLFSERPDAVMSPSPLPPASEMQPMITSSTSHSAALQPQPLVPVTPAAPPGPVPPPLGVAPHAPKRTQTPPRGAARSTPSRGLLQTFQDEEDVRDSPTHHVVAATRRSSQDGDETETSVDVAAATQTLQSIFPHADVSVLQLVLEECGYNVESAIDRLLEMT